MEWGSHLCQFYSGRQDLVDTLVPWFRTGLERHERCIWIAADPLGATDAREALRSAMPDLIGRETQGQIDIVDHDRWYLAKDGLASEDVLGTWLARESAALRDGWAGLRVSGNVSFLGPDDRRSFEAYEERVNRAFRDRRIVAICSYPLSGCRSDELLDVLRNHDRAIVSRDGAVRTVHGATLLLSEADFAAPSSTGARAPAEGHSVHFYDGALEIAPIMAFLEPAIRDGEGIVLIATSEHRRLILDELRAAGVDVATLLEGRRMVELDAHEALGRVAPEGTPSRTELRRLVGDLFDELSERHGSIAVYGEIVNVMARQERIAAAAELERIWNELLGEYPARLLCGYDLASFDHDHEGVALARICAEHSELADEEVASRAPDHLRVVLRQRTRLARKATRQVARLQNITAALAEAWTLERVRRVVADTVAHALDATSGTLLVPETDPSQGGTDPAGGGSTPREDDLRALATRLPVGQAWVATRAALAERFGDDVPDEMGAMAALPLSVGGAPLGLVAFAFRDERPFRLADRALFEDVARQVSIAVDRARLYRQAEQAREEAVRANQTKDAFLAMLGHELRNPLAPIVNALHVMELRGDERTARERMVLGRQVAHLHRLVEDLLDISRITHGRLQIETRPVELAALVGRAVEITAPQRAERRQELTLDVPTEDLLVDVDPDRLVQVVSNLMDNASKFTAPEGHLRVSARAEGSEGEVVVLRVHDSGSGMRPELAATVFDSFVQGARSTEVQGGLGVGLAIVRGLVEAHGGSVAASSPGPGKGSTFTVRLPRAQLERRGPAPEHRDQPAHATGAVRVLIVDDNIDAADALSDLVALFGGEPRIAYDGPTALREAETFGPGLVLLDIGLPGMSGHEVAARLRNRPDRDAVRIVAVTGFGQASDRARSLAAGCDEHWVKPLSPKRLEALVEELSRGEPGRAAEAT